jgi:A/G-specific adenine glycosylase
MSRNPEKDIPRLLLDWYRTNKRDLPWRKTSDPYRIWVAEIMLQQTRVATVIPYYERFLERFPDVNALARARLDAVLKAWEGLGYYSRARHLHEAARIVAGPLGGNVPSDLAELRKLPGVGAYTAGAILSIAFGKRAAAVDGNVIRVIARLFSIEDPVDGGKARKRIGELAARLVPASDPGHCNQALMDLGSGICTPGSPDCPACPLAEACGARRKGCQDSIPAKKAQAAVPRREAVAALIRNNREETLLIKRPDRGLLGGLWRFPGGLLKEGEKPAAGLRRILRDELGLKITPGREWLAVEHGYSHFSVTVHVLSCTIRGQLTDAGGCVQQKWVGDKRFFRLAVSRLERKILGALKRDRTKSEPIEGGKRPPKRVP